MRISAELLALAEQRINPLGEREIRIQGLGIPVIENISAAKDEYDTWDISNNRITKLENFPKLKRLTNLLLACNVIETIDANNMLKNLINLSSLTLSYNHITSLNEIKNIGIGFPKLEFLSLIGNPVTRRQYYRLYTIHKIPTLKSLDYTKVKPTEREKAARFAKSAAYAALESDLQHEGQQHQQLGMNGNSNNGEAKTFIPGEGLPPIDEEDFQDGKKPSSSAKKPVVVFTAEQKQQIRNLLANASSVKEVEEIENSVRKGILPEKLLKKDGIITITENTTDTITNTNNDNNTSNDHGGDEDEPTAKRPKNT